MSTDFTRSEMRVRGTIVAIGCFLLFGNASAGINEWTAAGPDGGYAADVAFHTTQAGTLFTTSGGRVYQSTNYGQSWSRLDPNVWHGRASMIAMDPDDPNEFYVATLGSVERMPAARVVTRTPPMLIPHPVNEEPEVIAAGDGDTAYAAINGRLFRTTDEGQNWEERPVSVNGAIASIQLISVDPSNANVLYGLAVPNLIRSSDGGLTWQVQAPVPADATISSLAIDFRNPQRIWLGTWYSGLLFSADAGGTWQTQLTTKYQVMQVALHPVDGNTVFVGTLDGDVMRSIDAGANWSTLSVNTGYLGKITINPRLPSEMAITGWTGVHVSTDSGATWSRRMTGLEATSIADFVRQPGTNRIYFWAGYEAGLHFLSSDTPALERVNEFGFTLLPRQSKLFDRHVAATSSTIFLQLDDRSVARTSSNGSLWQAGAPIDASPNVHIQVLEGSRTHAGTLFAGAVGAVYVSTDSGQSWTKRTNGIPADLSGMRLESSSSGAVYLGGSQGDPSTPHLLRSLDNGASWQPLPTPAASVSTIVVDPRDARILYVGLTDGLIKSTDEGATWTRIPQDYGNTYVQDIAFDPSDANVMYLTGGMGLARSVDGGATWTHIGTEIYSPINPARAAVDPRDPSRVLTATTANGLQAITFAPDLSFEANTPVTSAAAGTRLPFTIDVRNVGPWDATGVRLRLELTSGGSELAARVNGSSCTSDGRIATCALGLMRKNATIRVDADATKGNGSFQLAASVEGTQPDWRPTNNSTVITVAAPPAAGGSGGGGSLGVIGVLLGLALASLRVSLRARSNRAA